MILIVDDNIDEKIGTFQDLLYSSGFKIETASTLDDAIKKFKGHSNSLDAIILDYFFPESTKNIKFYNENNVPNGIVFLKEIGFTAHIKGIPLIINTASDEVERDKWLRQVPYYSNNGQIIYKSPAKQPLSFLSPILAKKLIDTIKQKKEEKETTSKIKPPQNSWNQKNKRFLTDSEGNYIGYNPEYYD